MESLKSLSVLNNTSKRCLTLKKAEVLSTAYKQIEYAKAGESERYLGTPAIKEDLSK
jgi:hypothetical protein